MSPGMGWGWGGLLQPPMLSWRPGVGQKLIGSWSERVICKINIKTFARQLIKVDFGKNPIVGQDEA